MTGDKPQRLMTIDERIQQVRQWRYEFKNPFPCDMCGKRFRNKALVKDHKQEVHAY